MNMEHHTQDDTTAEDVASTSLPPSSSTSKLEERNAFTTLMSPQKRPQPKVKSPPSTPATDPATKTVFLGRDGLGAYISDPASFPASRVIYHHESFVVINDLFPKSTIHLLLLPRDPVRSLMHPFTAFEDPGFRASVMEELGKLRSLAAKELKRIAGKHSYKEQRREAAMESDVTDWPEGRDWESEIVSGIHAGPSMNHLHVHVMSRDMHSACMRHRKHYNSFNTRFLVPVEDFPLDEDDGRRHPGREGSLDSDLVCWRCGRNFGNKFKRLKEHLDEEFEKWKKE